MKPPPAKPAPRPFLSVRFDCCGTYARVYKTADGRRYAGHCPRCCRPVSVAIAPGGSACRTWRVG